MRSILNFHLFRTMRLPFHVTHRQCLCCDLTIYRIDPHVKCRFNAEPFHSFMGCLNSPELSQSYMSHTQILWISTVHRLLSTQRTRPRGISSKDSSEEHWSYQQGWIVHHGHMKSNLFVELQTSSLQQSCQQNKGWYWSFWATILKNTF